MPYGWWIGSFSNKNPPKPAQNNAFFEFFRHKKRASWASIGDYVPPNKLQPTPAELAEMAVR
jgi:hypothetical protein